MNYFDTISYSALTGEFTWAVPRPGCRVGSTAGSRSSAGYIVVKLGRSQVRAHRLAWFLTYGRWPDGEVDHINGDRADNRIANLRVVDRAGNSQNRWSAHRDSSHGFLGVTWNLQHKRWQSKIVARGVRKHLGYFDTPEEAHAAYMRAKERMHIGGGCH